jgi:hypothetical protein
MIYEFSDQIGNDTQSILDYYKLSHTYQTILKDHSNLPLEIKSELRDAKSNFDREI